MMKTPLTDPELTTVTMFGIDYRSLTLIAQKEGLLNEKGKASMREVVHFLVMEYDRLKAKEMKKK